MKQCSQHARFFPEQPTVLPESEFWTIPYSNRLRAECKQCHRASRQIQRQKQKAAWHATLITPAAPLLQSQPTFQVQQPPPPPPAFVRAKPQDPSKSLVQFGVTAPLAFRPRKKIICLGDTHMPWHNPAAIATVVAIAAERQPDYIVQQGDLFDLLAFTRFPRSHNILTPAAELEEARKHAEWMWSRLRQAAPNAVCYQLRGNHDDRAAKRLMEELPVLEAIPGVMRSIDELFRFPGVTTIDDSKDVLELDDILFQHGYRPTAAAHAVYNGQSTVTGHLHHGGVTWHENKNGPFFSLNAGWLGDRHAPVFSYKFQKQIDRMTLGFGWIDQYGPTFTLLEDTRANFAR